jgi:hypothetical protein
LQKGGEVNDTLRVDVMEALAQIAKSHEVICDAPHHVLIDMRWRLLLKLLLLLDNPEMRHRFGVHERQYPEGAQTASGRVEEGKVKVLNRRDLFGWLDHNFLNRAPMHVANHVRVRFTAVLDLANAQIREHVLDLRRTKKCWEWLQINVACMKRFGLILMPCMVSMHVSVPP